MTIFQRLLSNHIPDNVKRLILLSTLGMKIKKPKTSDERKELIRRLNFELKLAKEEDALSFAVYFSNYVWKLLPETSYYSVLKTFKCVVAKVPEYLKYGNPKILREDVFRTLKIVCS